MDQIYSARPGRAWGQHLVLDLTGCPRDRLTSAQHVKNWVMHLVEAIDMKAYGEPIVEHFATHSHDAAGFTVLQLIETSNICAHFAENLGQVYIDVFSCKPFEPDTVVALCREYFDPSHVDQRELARGTFPNLLDEAV